MCSALWLNVCRVCLRSLGFRFSSLRLVYTSKQILHFSGMFVNVHMYNSLSAESIGRKIVPFTVDFYECLDYMVHVRSVVRVFLPTTLHQCHQTLGGLPPLLLQHPGPVRRLLTTLNTADYHCNIVLHGKWIFYYNSYTLSVNWNIQGEKLLEKRDNQAKKKVCYNRVFAKLAFVIFGLYCSLFI